METERREAEVVIVGAGLSGLLAAERLVHEHGVGSVLVLEARERIGGRIFDRAGPGGVRVEGGAQFVGAGQDRLAALLDRLGLETFPAEVEGRFRWVQEVFGLRLGLSPKIGEPPSFVPLRELVELLVEAVPIDAPWKAPNAGALDDRTFGAWLREHGSRSARAPLERLCRYHIGCDPDEVSLLYMLYYLSAVGGYESAVSGAHERRVVGGPQQICDRLAEQLGTDRILYGAPVRRVEWSGDGVTVHTDGVRVEARRAILALMPQLCGEIGFEPELPEERRRLHAELLTRRGRSAKVHLVYDAPFWRERGLSGAGATSSGVVFIDASPPDGSAGILLAFRDTRNPKHETPFMLRYARTLFGRPADDPRAVIETDWGEDGFSRACLCFAPPGLLTAAGPALRRPVGPIHWAGAETSDLWPGFMEGAVRAAERAAAECA